MKRLYVFFTKTLICFILFLVMAILCKKDVQYQNYVHSKIYEDSISFSSFKQFYNHYLGGIFPIENISSNNTNYVFSEKLVYEKASSYEDGVSLTVGYNYLIPNMEEGIVVYLGKKDKYGNVVMIENKDGIDIWYGNVCNVTVKLYDTVKVGSYLGESCDDIIYLVYSNKNKYLDYHDYLD